MRRRVALGVFVVACAVAVACNAAFTTAGNEDAASDGGAIDGDVFDVSAVDAPSTGFVVLVDPSHLTMESGDTFQVAVDLVRGSAFTGAVTIGVNGLPSGLAASPLTILAGQSAGQLTMTMTALPPQPDYVLTVFGATADGTQTSSTPLGIHAGTLLAVIEDDTSVVVPPFATFLTFKVWGAGGGGSHSVSGDSNKGGSGGGGGFAGATIPVTPGESLDISIGGGGPVGGGGGGYTAVRRSGAFLLLAGGGGGGGSTASELESAMCTLSFPGGNGGAGGGLTGANGSSGNGGGSNPGGGTQTAGGTAGTGASAGATLQGGAGAQLPDASFAGGKNGGGAAGYISAQCGGAGGGGGGGWFGGGGAAKSVGNGAGGGAGGGSGYLGVDGGTLTQGSGAVVANATDPDWAEAGTGGAGENVTKGSSAAAAGSGGRVVIRLTKP